MATAFERLPGFFYEVFFRRFSMRHIFFTNSNYGGSLAEEIFYVGVYLW